MKDREKDPLSRARPALARDTVTCHLSFNRMEIGT